MSITILKQSILARLLATENIHVVVGEFRTASFDVVGRVLRLPNWSDISKDVSDMLTGHEVSHALYTPADGWIEVATKYSHIPLPAFNIIEDARIEKLIQRKYPGLISVFDAAYRELIARDFFKLGNHSPQTRGFLDRINLAAKCGSKLDVRFDPAEQTLFDRVLETETFEEVVALTIEIYEFIKGRYEEDRPGREEESVVGESELSETEGREESSVLEDEEDSASPAPEELPEQVQKDLETGTYEAAAKSIGELKREDFPDGIETVHVPSDSELLSKIKETRRKNYGSEPDWIEYLKNSKKEIAPIVREFNARRAANRYARAAISDSGELDAQRLHEYRYSDDIFGKVMTLADAANHGMIMMVDFSGSMQSIMPCVIHQIITLTLFCSAINIPFEVYSYTSGQIEDRGRPDFVHLGGTRIYRMLDSGMGARECLKELARLREVWILKNDLAAYDSDVLGGTPTNEMLVIAPAIVRRFQDRTRVQKTSFILMTDGQPESSISCTAPGGRGQRASTLKFRESEIAFDLTYGPMTQSAILVSHLGAVTGARTIGFFIPAGVSDVMATLSYENTLARRGAKNTTSLDAAARARHVEVWKKEQIVSIPRIHGYDAFIILQQTSNFTLKKAATEITSKSVTMIKKQFLEISRARRRVNLFARIFASLIS